MAIRAVCWDWNGTLLDDLSICMRVMNRVLADYDRPAIVGAERYRRLFRFPISAFYADIGLGPDVFRDSARRYLELLPAEMSTATLHPGARDALARLDALDVRQALASATVTAALTEQLRPHAITRHFDEVLSIDDPYAASKHETISAWLDRSGFAHDEVLMIGDTNHDREIAAALGTAFVHFDGGHQRAPQGVPRISDLSELPPLVGAL